MGNGARGAAGFTLLELLVGLMLFGLLASLLTGSLTFGRRAWETGEAAFARSADLRLVQSFLREQFGAAQLSWNPADDEVVGFEGRPGSATFLCGVSERMAAGGLRRVTVAVEDDGSGRRLSLTQRPIEANGASGTQRILLEGAGDARFEYFGAVPSDDAPAWHAVWKEAGRLPSLVRLRIAFEDTRRQWPDLIAGLAVTGDPACHVDAAAPSCRGR